MKRITCKECRAFDASVDGYGLCRREAPHVVSGQYTNTRDREKLSDYVRAIWTTTKADDWCMESIPLKTYNEMETKDV